MYLELTDGGIKIGFGGEDISTALSIWKRVLGQSEKMLSMDLAALRHFYKEADWVDPEIPYECVANSSELSGSGWLNLEWALEDFELPIELLSHRDTMVSKFDQAGRLRKGIAGIPQNQDCPRVTGYDQAGKKLHLQKACYFDQLATNLSLDFPLVYPLNELGETIRKIDRSCSLSGRHLRRKRLAKHGLRPFADSSLANTLGVACLVVFSGGKTLYRLRNAHTSIYGDCAHLPVSFAQELTQRFRSLTTLEELVMRDLPLEFNQETRLEFSTFIERVEPIGLFRDMQRAGKPQLFLKLIARGTVRDFADAMAREIAAAPVPEYKAKLNVIETTANVQMMSTELAAALNLLQQ